MFLVVGRESDFPPTKYHNVRKERSTILNSKSFAVYLTNEHTIFFFFFFLSAMELALALLKIEIFLPSALRQNLDKNQNLDKQIPFIFK